MFQEVVREQMENIRNELKEGKYETQKYFINHLEILVKRIYEELRNIQSINQGKDASVQAFEDDFLGYTKSVEKQNSQLSKKIELYEN